MHVYTDGSFTETEVEAVDEAACAYSFHGFAAGSLVVGSEEVRPPAWVGALKAGCDTAGLAGTTWACRWCINRMEVETGMSGLLVALHVDSQYAISSVNGHERPVVNDEAVHYARAAKCILETSSVVTLEWTAGHSGHPWNELADAAAKQAAHEPAMLELWIRC